MLGLVMKQGMRVAPRARPAARCSRSAREAVTGALYGVSPIDPIAWLRRAARRCAAVSVLANIIPARRAARVDPSVALRSEA